MLGWFLLALAAAALLLFLVVPLLTGGFEGVFGFLGQYVDEPTVERTGVNSQNAGSGSSITCTNERCTGIRSGTHWDAQEDLCFSCIQLGDTNECRYRINAEITNRNECMSV